MTVDSFFCCHDNERNEINIPYQFPISVQNKSSKKKQQQQHQQQLSIFADQVDYMRI